MKCDACGLESARAEIFRTVPGSFGRKSRTLCPACHGKRDDKVYVFLFRFFVVVAISAFLLTFIFPNATIGPGLLNVVVLQLFVFAETLLHELGHALAAQLAGFRVFRIEIGRGRIVREFMRWGFRWQFRAMPFGGCAYGAPRDSHAYRWRESAFILGGPLVNALLLVGAVAALPLQRSLQVGAMAEFAPVTMLILSNAMMLLYSLWPHYFESGAGKLASDGLLLWQTWRRPQSENAQMPSLYYFLESQECRDAGRFDEAQKWVKDGLEKFPRSYVLEMMQGVNLLDLKEYREARHAFILLLGRYSKVESIRCTLLNDIAWAGVLTGEAELLAEADACSRMALERMPWVVYFKGTRGSVLTELGNYEDALKLLHDALKNSPEKSGQALNACYIGIAEARRGHLDESRNYFSVARTLDPLCVLLDREPAAISSLSPNQ